MKWSLISIVLLLSGCKISSVYPPLGATAGATAGSIGGPAMAGGGALLGWGVGKGVQVVDENKELQEAVELLSEGDVQTIAQNALKKGMESQEGKFQEFIGKIEKLLIVVAIGLVIYLFIPILVARKTATSCSNDNKEKLKKQLSTETRPPFQPKHDK
jgi:hypothetical protein